MKQTIKAIYAILFIGLLASCGVATPVPTSEAIKTFPPSPVLASSTPAIPTATFVTTPISPVPVSSSPDGLRMAYIVDKNLYIQNAGAAPIQITDSGDDRYPVFSDDGERLIFYRGLVPHELYSIHADGTQEQVLVTGSSLESLGLGYDKFTEISSLAYVPGTHQVLFNTRQLSQEDIDQQDFNRLGSKANSDLLSVDIDTGEIKSILSRGKGGNFHISPDGSMVAVQTKGHINVISRDGQIIRRNLVTYTPTKPYELIPGVFWVKDATELIVTLPVGMEYNMDGPETRSIWRCTIDNGAKVQVSFTPPLIGSDLDVSPDGNWILYDYFYYPGKTDETITSGLYLGNLRDSTTRLYVPGTTTHAFSPDSIHFMYYVAGRGYFLGRVDEQPVRAVPKGFLDWAGAGHYLSYYTMNGSVIGVLGEIGEETIYFPLDVPGSSLSNGSSSFTFIYLDQ